MQLLCIDVGSGTQDILLLDIKQKVENAAQMVLPAPSVQITKKIERATRCGIVTVINMSAVYQDMLERAFSCWNIKFKPDAIGVPVLDYGAAPLGESQRKFRFQQLEEALRNNNTLGAFAFTSNKVFVPP